MAKQTINIGASVNDGTGDPLRTAFDKINDNFDEVYLAGFVGQNLAIDGNTIESTNTNGNIILDPNGTGIVQVTGDLVVSGALRGDGSSLIQIENDVQILGDYEITGALTVTTVDGNLIPSANVTYDLGNSTNRWNDLYLSGNTISLGSITLKDDSGALGIFAADGTTLAGIGNATTFTATGNITGGNLITGGVVSATGNVSGGNVTTSGVFAGDGSSLTSINGSNIASGTVPSARLSGTYTIDISGSATTAGTVTTAAQPNITSVGTLTSVAVTGNIETTGGYFIGDGSQLANVVAVASPAGNAAEVQFNQGGVATSGHQGFTYTQGNSSVIVTGNLTSGNLITAGSLSLGGTIVTATATELNYVDGVTSAIQTQLNAKVETLSDLSITSTAAEINKLDGYTGSVTELNYLDTLHATGVTSTEFDYLDGVTSNIQTQLNAKAPTASPTFTTQITTPSIVKSGSNAVGNIGSSANYFNTVFADTFEGTSTSAQYADLAENYSSDQEYEPGTVVVLGGEAEVTHSTRSHDTAVAGVISTAPAYLMNSTSDGVAVALQGRVPCKVLGPIRKGELLVTSQHEGVAQKLDDSLYKPGCVIGKSIEDIQDSTIKVIEILVGRV